MLFRSAIEGVSAPRQTLEELFLDIVERARAEQIATSGAQSGGRIASFLQGGEGGAEGSAVVDQLVKAASAPAVAPPPRPTPAEAQKKGADKTVLDALVDKPAAPAAPVSRPAAPEKKRADSAVDQGLIDSLLDGGGKKKDGEGRG